MEGEIVSDAAEALVELYASEAFFSDSALDRSRPVERAVVRATFRLCARAPRSPA
jgi:hypothetical protein